MSSSSSFSSYDSDGHHHKHKGKKDKPSASSHKWDDEWKACFLEGVRKTGIEKATPESIFEFMKKKHPHRNIEKKHVESYWKDFRRKLCAKHGLSKDEFLRNEHMPK